MLNALDQALTQALESSHSPHSNTASVKDSENKQVISEKSSEKIDLPPSFSEKSTEDKILILISRDSKISATKIADKLNLTARTIENHIAKLKADNKLKRIGAAKGGYWQVKPFTK